MSTPNQKISSLAPATKLDSTDIMPIVQSINDPNNIETKSVSLSAISDYVVAQVPSVDASGFVQKSGDTISGTLTFAKDGSSSVNTLSSEYMIVSKGTGSDQVASSFLPGQVAVGSVSVGTVTIEDATVSAVNLNGSPKLPTENKHLTVKKYVDDSISTKVSKTGDTMSGSLWFSSLQDNSVEIQESIIRMIDTSNNSVSIIKSNEFTIQANTASGPLILNMSPGKVNIDGADKGFIHIEDGEITANNEDLSPKLPTKDDHLTVKKYVDDSISDLGDTLIPKTGANDLSGSFVISGTDHGTTTINDNYIGISYNQGVLTEVAMSLYSGPTWIVGNAPGQPAQNYNLTTKAYVDNKTAAVGAEFANTFLPLAGGTLAGQLSLPAGGPTQDQHAASKYYVDQLSAGLKPKASVNVATTVAIPGVVTYANGTSGVNATLTLGTALTTLDGVALVNGNRILVKDQANAIQNGVYLRTSSTVLTRATDADEPNELPQGAYYYVSSGTLNRGNSYAQSANVNTLGTDSISYILVNTAASSVIKKYSKEWHVDPIGGDDTTGTGSYGEPYKTITKALTVAGNTGEAIILHQGVYSDTVTVTQLNLDIIGSGRQAATCSGAWTFASASSASSVRVKNCKFNGTVTHNNASGLYFDDCDLAGNFSRTAGGYVEMKDCSQGPGSLSITGGNYFNSTSSRHNAVTINNAAALVSFLNSPSLTNGIVLTAGVLNIDGCFVFPVSDATHAIIASNSPNNSVWLFDSVISSASGSAGAGTISVACAYSIDDVQFNRSASTLTGVNYGAFSRFDNIDTIGTVTLGRNPTTNLEAATKQYVDSSVANANVDTSGLVAKSGSTMTGALLLHNDPTDNLGATTKRYVDGKFGLVNANKLALAGGTMSGNLILNADPTDNLGAATKQYVDNATVGKGASWLYISKTAPFSTGTITDTDMSPFFNSSRTISSGGTNDISVDTTTGKINLKAGRTYRLSANMVYGASPSPSAGMYRWCLANFGDIGNIAGIQPSSNAGNDDVTAEAFTILSPTQDTSVWLRTKTGTNMTYGSSSWGYPYIYVETIDNSGGGTGGGASIASQITSSQYGNITATDVQAAINQLDDQTVLKKSQVVGLNTDVVLGMLKVRMVSAPPSTKSALQFSLDFGSLNLVGSLTAVKNGVPYGLSVQTSIDSIPRYLASAADASFTNIGDLQVYHIYAPSTGESWRVTGITNTGYTNNFIIIEKLSAV